MFIYSTLRANLRKNKKAQFSSMESVEIKISTYGKINRFQINKNRFLIIARLTNEKYGIK